MYIRNKDYRRTLEDLEAAHRLSPANADYAAQLAVFKFRTPEESNRDLRQALGFAEKACALRPDIYFCRLVAAIHAELGDFANAEKWELKGGEALKTPVYAAGYREKNKLVPEYEIHWQVMLKSPPFPAVRQGN